MKKERKIILENIVFRRATERDISQILELQRRVFSGEQNIPAGEIPAFLAKKPQCWCAVCGGQIVGTAAAWKEGGSVHWGRFATDPDYRGRHIGRRIAQLSFDELFTQGIDEIYMEAREITAGMVCRMGGRIIGEPQPFYVGTVTPVTLRKEDYHPCE